MSPERRIIHRANVKARYHERKAAGLCVGCEVKRDPAAGDTDTQCRGCADYRNMATKDRRTT